MLLGACLLLVSSQLLTAQSPDVCQPGQTKDLQNVCWPCHAGTYSAGSNAPCALCDMGWSSALGATACFKCPVNTYSNTRGGACSRCPLQSFQPWEGMTRCDPCELWYDGLTMSPEEYVQECPYKCRPGYTLLIREAFCTPCPVGSYSTGVYETWGILNPKCTPCGLGSSGPFESFNQADCFQCPAGTYGPNPTGPCVQCSAGTYTPAAGYSSAVACPEGKFNPADGMTYCIDCEPWDGKRSMSPAEAVFCRQFCFEGQTIVNDECTPCPAGTYSQQGFNPVCTTCEPGQTSPAGASACVPCRAGTYGVNGQCVLCPISTYTDVPGMPNCTECYPGHWGVMEGMDNFGDACNLCFSTPAWGGNIYLTKSCTQGQFVQYLTRWWTSLPLVKACVSCQQGTYNPDTQNTYLDACPPCPAGTAAPAVESTSCQTCAPNSYSTQGSSVCIPCQAGYWSPAQASSCQRLCLAGTYLSSDTCITAPHGSHTPTDKLTAPIPCSEGSYNTGPGLSYCTACPTGKWGTVVGATSEALACPNTWVDTSAPYTTCTGGVSCVLGRCGAGKFKNPLDRSCTICPAGTYQPTPPTTWAPYQFTYQGYYVVRQNSQKYFNQSVYEDIRWNNVIMFHYIYDMIALHPRGPMWRQFLKPTPPATALSITADLTNTAVNGNEYVGQTYTRFVNDPLCYKGGTTWNCTDGEWLPAALLYSTPDAVVNFPCKPCPPGTYAPLSGSLVCANCSAIAHESSVEGSSACAVCIAGYYKAADGCVICPPGFYCWTAATAPTACAGGYYCKGYGLSAPSACQPGFICPPGSVNPTPCPAGKVCMGSMLQAPTGTCSTGYYCPGTAGGGGAIQCYLGEICPYTGMTAPQPCTPGYACQRYGLTAPDTLCPRGSFCPLGSIVPTKCTAGSACPYTGATIPTLCTTSYWCPSIGLSSMLPCPGGSFCMLPGIINTQRPCTPGKICPPGVSSPLPCPKGYRCLSSGLSQPTPCGYGFYCPFERTLIPTPCLEGYHCPLINMTAPLLCSIGYHCPTGASAMLDCPTGSICPTQGMSTPEPCPELVNGRYLPSATHKENM